MDKKTKQILLFAGVGILAYMWWKNKQDSTSNAIGRAGGYACPCYCFGSFTDNDEKCCGEGNSERCKK